jgi:hypothetical protein
VSYKILSRDEKAGTMVVLCDGNKLNIRIPSSEEGTPEFDSVVEAIFVQPKGPDWYNEPGSDNKFKRTMPIYDRRKGDVVR